SDPMAGRRRYVQASRPKASRRLCAVLNSRLPVVRLVAVSVYGVRTMESITTILLAILTLVLFFAFCAIVLSYLLQWGPRKEKIKAQRQFCYTLLKGSFLSLLLAGIIEGGSMSKTYATILIPLPLAAFWWF